jgi:hypothetical protein
VDEAEDEAQEPTIPLRAGSSRGGGERTLYDYWGIGEEPLALASDNFSPNGRYWEEMTFTSEACAQGA